MVFVERLSAAGVTAVARVEGPAALVADPAIASDLQIGGWFDGRPRRRMLRRLLTRLPPPVAALGKSLPGRAARVVAEGAFWRGVRRAATELEWRRLTRSSYVVLYYHRLAG